MRAAALADNQQRELTGAQGTKGANWRLTYKGSYLALNVQRVLTGAQRTKGLKSKHGA